MSAGTAWMPLYVGDYLGDTMHLDHGEHGAYLLLIMHYWRTGPLPDDDKALAGISRSGAAWAQVGPVVRRFFQAEQGLLYHKRIDAERAKALDVSSKRRAAGIAGASVRYSKPLANAMASATVLPEQTHRQSQSQSQSESDITYTPPLPPKSRLAPAGRGKRARVIDDPAFEAFWEAYPRKVGKGQAREAWRRAVAKVGPAAVQTGLDRATWPANAEYIPHPSTWLNGERWADEAPSNTLADRLDRVLAAPTLAIEWKE